MMIFAWLLNRGLNTARINQSFKIVTNLIAAGVLNHSIALDNIICAIAEFVSVIIEVKISDSNGFLVKVKHPV